MEEEPKDQHTIDELVEKIADLTTSRVDLKAKIAQHKETMAIGDASCQKAVELKGRGVRV